MTGRDTKKLQELILYIAERSEGDPRFGKTKLFKILFYADFIRYMQTGESITGTQYRKAPFGPLAADGEATLESLDKDRSLVIGHRQYHGRPQQRPFALREPDLTGFSAEEIALVNEVLGDLWEQTAAEVSQLSHDFIGWKDAAMGEIIPYETTFLSDRLLTEAEYLRGADLAVGANLEPAGAV